MEQPFRDRSNTLSEKPALPVIRDKDKDLTGEVEVSHLSSPGLSTEAPPPEKVLVAFTWGDKGQGATRHQSKTRN